MSSIPETRSIINKKSSSDVIKYLKSRVRANCSAASFLFFGIKSKFCSANTRTSCQGVFVPSLCRKCLIAVEERTDDDVIFTIKINFSFIFTFRGISVLPRLIIEIKKRHESIEDSCLQENKVHRMVSKHNFQKEYCCVIHTIWVG